MPSSRDLMLIHSLEDLMMNNHPPPQTMIWMETMVTSLKAGDSPVKSVTDADTDPNMVVSEDLYKLSERKQQMDDFDKFLVTPKNMGELENEIFYDIVCEYGYATSKTVMKTRIDDYWVKRLPNG